MPNRSLSPLSRFGIFILAGGALCVIGLLIFLNYGPLPKSAKIVRAHKAAPGNPATAPALNTPAVAAESAAARAAREKAVAVADLEKTIDQALAVLNDPAIPDKREALRALREALKNADAAVGIAAARQFLATGQDGKTGERFKVGPGGVLTTAPTLRTLLMDQLGTWSNDLHAPDAAQVAQEVLQNKTSADEWAVSLRNLSWSDPEGSKATLAAKARELISYQPWQQAPTAGYMEAFDAAAFSGDATLIDILAPLGKDKSPIQQAALVAIDRLSAMAPSAVANYLNSHPDILADRPLMRADYMGKVDLSDATQKAEAETYLNRSDVTLPEKTKFLERLGVPAGFVSNNLLTPPTPPAMPLLERRALVNQTASSWLSSGQFPTLQGALQTLVEDTRPAGGS